MKSDPRRSHLLDHVHNLRIAILGILLLTSLVGINVRSAYGQVSFVFTPTSTQTGSPGQTLDYHINITNGAFAASLQGFRFTVDGQDLTLDSTPFESFLIDPATPDPLPANYSNLDLSTFLITVGENALPGIYNGTASLIYNTFDQFEVSQSFTVEIVADQVTAPEPSTLFLLVIGILVVPVIIRRKNRVGVIHRLCLHSLLAVLCGGLAAIPATAQTGYRYLRTIAAPQPGQFKGPKGIAVDRVGNIFVVDTNNNRIQKFDANGTFLLSFGGRSSTAGGLDQLSDVATDSVGNVYVTDRGPLNIVKFDGNGVFLRRLGSSGTGPEQFRSPNGVVVDSSGNLYVGDSSNYRVQKLDKEGRFLLAFGSQGTDEGQFGTVSALAQDRAGNIYVVDTVNRRVQKFDKDGKFLLAFASQGNGTGPFSFSNGVAVDSAGNVYVTASNGQVLKFDENGAFLSTFGTLGEGDGQFRTVSGLAADAAGNVFVTDATKNRVQRFSSVGSFLNKFGEPNTLMGPLFLAFDQTGSLLVTDSGSNSVLRFSQGGTLLSSFGAPPSSNGQFIPLAITVDPFGSIFVSDPVGQRIVKFNSGGGYLFSFTLFGGASVGGAFRPQITTDPEGNFYIADFSNHRIQKFDGQGGFIRAIGSAGFGAGLFINPRGVAVDKAGNLFASDAGAIQKFAPNGQPLLTFPQTSGNQTLSVDKDGYVYVSNGFNRILKYRNNGTFVLGLGEYGDTQLVGATGTALDAAGNLYVADTGSSRIVVFAPDPALLDLQRTPAPTVTKDNATGDFLVTVAMTNLGTNKSEGGRIVGARLNRTATKNTLPVLLPEILTRDMTNVVLRFPADAAVPGTTPFVFVDLAQGGVKSTVSVRTKLVP